MSIIKKPPVLESINTTMTALFENSEYSNFMAPTDSEGRYFPFDKFRFRTPAGLNVNINWTLTRHARDRVIKEVIDIGENKEAGRIFHTHKMFRAMSEVDRHATTAALEWVKSNIGEQKHFDFLISELEDEAISSSQMEGAATTTKVAKELIKNKIEPHTDDEKMIIGNLKMMRHAWNNRSKPLSIELIKEIHITGVKGINDDEYGPGIFRSNEDEVYVVGKDGEELHTPPCADSLVERLERFIDWVNDDHHKENSKIYLHPLIKAMIMHFMIGYEHPFKDGNGRVARSLFYWYMFKQDYAAFKYISISSLLKNKAQDYCKSYLYTETDNLDLTYFVDYQCEIVIEAVNLFRKVYFDTAKEFQKFNSYLIESGLYSKLSDKQRMILHVAEKGIADKFTANNVMQNLECSYNTAATALNGLVDNDLFFKFKEGRTWIYKMNSIKNITDGWVK